MTFLGTPLENLAVDGDIGAGEHFSTSSPAAFGELPILIDRSVHELFRRRIERRHRRRDHGQDRSVPTGRGGEDATATRPPLARIGAIGCQQNFHRSCPRSKYVGLRAALGAARRADVGWRRPQRFLQPPARGQRPGSHGRVPKRLHDHLSDQRRANGAVASIMSRRHRSLYPGTARQPSYRTAATGASGATSIGCCASTPRWHCGNHAHFSEVISQERPSLPTRSGGNQSHGVNLTRSSSRGSATNRTSRASRCSTTCFRPLPSLRNRRIKNSTGRPHTQTSTRFTTCMPQATDRTVS